MLFKNLKLQKTAIFLAAAILSVIPSIVLAQWTVGTAPNGLPSDELDLVLSDVINGILGLVGIVSVLFMVYGGARYLTSAGDESKIESAKTTLTYAVLGLGFSALAYAIVTQILSIIK